MVRDVNTKILSGLRVLDLTRVLAGPYATRILADFGAEVIKVQSRKIAAGAKENASWYFNAWNRNKLSITLDLDFVEARELFLKLASISDVVIENFSPRVMANWGLTYERLREVNADLIMVSMSGMGQTGPWRDYVAFGPTIQSLSGLTYLSSFSSDAPLGLGFAYADVVAGLYAAVAVLAALEFRDERGTGLYIDLSEYEAACTVLGPSFLDIFANQTEISAQGNRSDYLPAAPHGCYRCQGEDRWCVIAVFNEFEWNALCKVMRYPRWTREERFSSPSKRKKHSKALDTFVEQWTETHEAEDVFSLLHEAGVPAGIVQNAEDLANDPHLMARDFFVHLQHPILGSTISDGSPIKFARSTTSEEKVAPLLGGDNRYVFIERLGLTEEELSSYTKMGIIG
jgi:crotonobetainyl-CoA:carnitine CoA-transferase CaiB-like acyl-CoA transferase